MSYKKILLAAKQQDKEGQTYHELELVIDRENEHNQSTKSNKSNESKEETKL